jgi:hypothetical protein
MHLLGILLILGAVFRVIPLRGFRGGRPGPPGPMHPLPSDDARVTGGRRHSTLP